VTSVGAGVARVESGLAFIDRLPDRLLRRAIATRFGSLRERVEGVVRWRDALLDGRLPPASPPPWPGDPIGRAARDALERLGIAPFCKYDTELTDDLLDGLLADIARFSDDADEQIREIRERYAARLAAAASPPPRQKRHPSRRAALGIDGASKARVEQLRFEAARAEAEVIATRVAASVEATWKERAELWHRVAAIFGDLGDLLGCGYDLSLGILRHRGWLDLARLRDLLESEPRLRELVAALGRQARSACGREESVMERFVASLSRAGEVVREVPMPGIPPDVRGVTRSDDLARVLPAEVSLLRHPVARKLFFARLAERSLATYQVEGVAPQRVLETTEETGEVEREVRRAADGAGPILLCIDTSGSMAGAPETIAKAIALEAMRIAHREGRRCFLWAFSGPGQVEAHELRLDASGLAELLKFLLVSFHGGTDVAGPVTAACAKLAEEDWRRADLAIVTDGSFSVSPATLATLERARKECGLRVRGVLVGRGSGRDLASMSDHVERVDAWEALLRAGERSTGR
jgi:uncharacterized protein with von Willebrand factor type A (vWA) domain